MKEFISKTVVIIPSYNPDENMVKYVTALKNSGFPYIIVVDDGSKQSTQKYFEQVTEVLGENGVVLRHYVNEGKGRALKTALHYFGWYFANSDKLGVVTADADGQHSVADTVKVAETLAKKNEIVLGTRDFDEGDTPFKSKFGNKTTTIVFSILFGKKINDTQTGLRGIPNRYIDRFISLRGERFEYEINMLIDAVASKGVIIEEPIETIYFESNRATHFSAVKDSAKIYGAMFLQFILFSIVGLASFAIDIVLFAIAITVIEPHVSLSTGILIATVLSRMLSSVFNFMFVKNIVFNNTNKVRATIFKYYSLWCAQLIVSWGLVYTFTNIIKVDVIFIKVLVDFLLFFISFRIQRQLIFKKSTVHKGENEK